MPERESAKALDVMRDPGRQVRIARTASGLLVARCVERRVVGAESAGQIGGNAVGIATLRVVRGEAKSMEHALRTNQVATGIRDGAHVGRRGAADGCGANYGLLPISRSIAGRDGAVVEAAGVGRELAIGSLPRNVDLEVYGLDEKNFFAVPDRFERALPLIEEHDPERTIEILTENFESSVLMRGASPNAADGVTWDLTMNRLVPEPGSADDTQYLDTSLDLIAESAADGKLNPATAAEAIWYSAGVANLLASGHKIPLRMLFTETNGETGVHELWTPPQPTLWTPDQGAHS